MGDVINHAPALRTACIRISLGTVVDIAKEAGDIILLKKLDKVSQGSRLPSNGDMCP